VSHKKYLLTLIGATILLLLPICIVEFGVRGIPSPYRTKFESIRREHSNLKVLILGSSHFYFGVNPQYFSVPTLNAANVSQDFHYDLHILKVALEKNDNIKYVVVPMSIFSLFSELDTGIESWRKYEYRLYMGYKDYPASEWFSLANHSVILASQNKLGLLRRLAKYLIDSPVDQDWTEGGWGKRYSTAASEAMLQSSGKTAALRHQQNAKLSEVSIESLNEIAKLCRAKDIKLLIVTPPAFISYRDNIDAQRLAKTTAVASTLVDSSPNIKYVSYFSHSAFEALDYFDADHLNHRGAEKLSRMIDGLITNW
jgi:hypothetical protein